MNDGHGVFSYDFDRAPDIGDATFTAELIDVDGDGFVDLITAHLPAYATSSPCSL